MYVIPLYAIVPRRYTVLILCNTLEMLSKKTNKNVTAHTIKLENITRISNRYYIEKMKRN